MEEQTGGTKPIMSSDHQKRQNYGRDAAEFSTSELPDPEDEDSHISTSKETGSSCKKRRMLDLAESLQILTESLLTMEHAEMEIFKEREAIRLEEEKRRLEFEAEMTRMLLQSQLQIASFLTARQSPNRKRKRVQEDDRSSSVSLQRNGALLLSLIQLNMITF